MTDNTNLQTTRRDALKLIGGTATAAVGFSGAATAGTVSWDESDVVTDVDGNGQWILRIDRGVSAETEVTVETAKQTAAQSQEPLAETLESMDGYRVKKQFWLANSMLVDGPEDPETAEAELLELSGVEVVHPNFETEAPEPVEEQLVPRSGHDQYQYGLPQTNVPNFWDRFGTQGEGASVSVVDTGIDPDHPDIDFDEDNWAVFNFDGDSVDTGPFDQHGHGTHVSGTVVGGQASGLEGEPWLGVAPGAELYHANVFPESPTTFAAVLAGMEWSIEQDVDIINMSLGRSAFAGAYIEPSQNAISAGTLIISSSGNDGPGTSGSPANVYDNLSIGATDPTEDVTGFSSGQLVETEEAWHDDLWEIYDLDHWPINYYVPDVSGPGSNVLSWYPVDMGGYARLSGTSMSSPHVAGIAALLRSVDPDITPVEIKEYLMATARHGDGPEALPGPRYGEGIVDALSAATAVKDGNVVSGTVTYDGEPVSGIDVESDYGTFAETTSAGEYTLLVGDGEWEIDASPFGLHGTATVDVSGGEEMDEVDIELEDALDVSISALQGDVADSEETVGVAVDVANLESVTVSLGEESDYDEGDLDMFAIDEGGESIPLTFDEAYEFEEPYSGDLFVGCTVESDDFPGDVALTHKFEGTGRSIGPIETGPTTVMEDPADANLEITDWDETTEIELGSTLQAWVEVENTGDRTAQQPVAWWLGDPDGINVFVADFVELRGGESQVIDFAIGIPATFVPPGTEIPHGWQTDDDLVSVNAMFVGPLHVFTDVEAPKQVDRGETIKINATMYNVGFDGTENVSFMFRNSFVDSAEVSAEPEGTDTVSFELDSGRVVRDRYDWTLLGAWGGDVEDAMVTGSVWVGPVQVPPEFAPYVDDDMIVTLEGLSRAISDWRAGELEIGDLSAIIDAWRSQEPVA